MAANSLIFKDAEKARDAIVASQKQEIAQLYENWADDIGKKAKAYSHKLTPSSFVAERQMKELQKQIRETSHQISNEIYDKIKQNIYTISDEVVADNAKWLATFGFPKDSIDAAFSYVPDNIVRNLITGQIYEGGWNLSSRIWSDNEKTLKDIYQVMAKGMAENKPIYNIAKELEAYVRPSAKLPWNLTASDGVKIYKKQIDYNAQRLARTLVQHGYQQSFIATTQNNPFIEKYIWRANGSRVCELCADRDGQEFDKHSLPMDHPNGMCTMEPVVVDDLVDRLADWFNSPDGTYPEIDEFAGNFGHISKQEIKLGSKDKPMTLSSDAFKKYVEQNDAKVIYRGYSASSQEELDSRFNALIQGNARVSGEKSSALGKGVYFSDTKNEANDYMVRRMNETKDKFGKVDEVTFKTDAKIIDYDKLHTNKLEEESKLLDKAIEIKENFGSNPNEYEKAKNKYYDIADMNYDEYAKYKGYDAIYHKGTGYTVVINQKSLIIKK